MSSDNVGGTRGASAKGLVLPGRLALEDVSHEQANSLAGRWPSGYLCCMVPVVLRMASPGAIFVTPAGDGKASLIEDRRHDLLRLCARIGFSPPTV